MVFNKSRKSNAHKLGFDTSKTNHSQKHKYIELQYLKWRKLFFIKEENEKENPVQQTQSRKRKQIEDIKDEQDLEYQQHKSKIVKTKK